MCTGLQSRGNERREFAGEAVTSKLFGAPATITGGDANSSIRAGECVGGEEAGRRECWEQRQTSSIPEPCAHISASLSSRVSSADAAAWRKGSLLFILSLPSALSQAFLNKAFVRVRLLATVTIPPCSGLELETVLLHGAIKEINLRCCLVKGILFCKYLYKNQIRSPNTIATCYNWSHWNLNKDQFQKVLIFPNDAWGAQVKVW